MDVGDLVTGGLIIGGAYLAYRIYTSQRNADAAPGTQPGNTAANMNGSAVRSTVFGGDSILRRLLPPKILAPAPALLSATASPIAAARAGARAGAATAAAVARAAAMPQVNAPSPNTNLLIPSSGLRGARPTMPHGDGPQPGDPRPSVFLRGLR